eukprot:scaffold487866_cov30-Prasinocladus_malaysianus.AAC.1
MPNPYQVNDRSVADAITTPATIGTRVTITGTVGTLPKKMNDRNTVKNGSSDLMVWVRETFTAPRDILVVKKPTMWSTERGNTDSTVRRLTTGACLSFINQLSPMRAEATSRWMKVQNMLEAYQAARRPPMTATDFSCVASRCSRTRDWPRWT